MLVVEGNNFLEGYSTVTKEQYLFNEDLYIFHEFFESAAAKMV